MPPRRIERLVAGVVAYNDAASIADSIRSLLEQTLPQGAVWSRVWVVASGCTDGTQQIVRSMAERDRRIELVEEPVRRGKAAALAVVLERAQGEFLFLLNGDARALPGAVEGMLRRAAGVEGPFAVMARPVPDRSNRTVFSRALGLFWEVHHGVHEYYLALGGQGNHLSDELLLLPLSHRPPLAAGIVNDGAFVGAWLRRLGGQLLYAPDARVLLDSPKTVGDHVRQRSRIRFGHRQIAGLWGVPTSTFAKLLKDNPRGAWSILHAAYRTEPAGAGAILLLSAAEIAALVHGVSDVLFRRRDYVLWIRIGSRSPKSRRTSVRAARSARSPRRSD